jgi:phage terminase large subunit-like protein
LDRGAAIERRHAVTLDGTVEGEPVLFSRERVAEKRREQGPYMFASQMLLDPTADRKQGFLEDWLRYYRGSSNYDNMNKYLLVDSAGSKKRKNNDYTSMGVIGLGQDQNYYLLDAIRDRLSLRERGDALFELHRRWRPKGTGYEVYGLQSDVEYFKERMNDENYRFEIVELGGQIAKNERIRRLIPIFEAGRFHLPEHLIKIDYEGRHVDLVPTFINDEYKPFPVALHDDMFDMISRICDADMNVIWPKGAVEVDRYARSRVRPRAASAWAA